MIPVEPRSARARAGKARRDRNCKQRLVREGRCAFCGKPRNHYAFDCDACHEKHLIAERRRNKSIAWRPGMGGRPAKDVR